MNIELYNRYGDYTPDGRFIQNHEKYHYYMERPKLMKRKKILAWCCMLIPIIGIIGLVIHYEEMGIDIL